MHRHHTLAGQDVVEEGEDRLLVLACVFRVADQDQFPFEIQRDDRVRVRARTLGIGLETGTVDDGELGYEIRKLVGLWPAQQVAASSASPSQPCRAGCS